MTTKRKDQSAKPRTRNPVAANNPTLRKGGPHGKTRKAQRRAAKQSGWAEDSEEKE